MEYVECRTHDTICIGERIRLTVLQRERGSVTLAVVAAPQSAVRFGYGALRGEPLDASNIRYLLPMLTGDCFTVDDIRVGVGLYLDRREIAANDDCDVQLQISRLEADRPHGGRHAAESRGVSAHVDGSRDRGAATHAAQTPDRQRAGACEHTSGSGRRIEIRRLRGEARPVGERSAPCSP